MANLQSAARIANAILTGNDNDAKKWLKAHGLTNNEVKNLFGKVRTNPQAGTNQVQKSVSLAKQKYKEQKANKPSKKSSSSFTAGSVEQTIMKGATAIVGPGSSMGKINKMTRMMHRLTSAFGDHGVTAAKAGDRLRSLRRRNMELGVTYDDIGNVATSFYDGLSAAAIPNFQVTAESIMQQQLELKKLGIEGGNVKDIYNTWTSAFGMNAEQMNKARGVILRYGKDTNQSATIFKDFTAISGQFMDVLDPNVMHRQGLAFATMAKRVGVGGGQLMGGLKSFDTMDSAQKIGGELTAVLGPMGIEFDAVKASMMDLPERAKYFSDIMKQAGKHAGQFGPRTQRMLMQAVAGTGFLGGDMKTIRGFMSGRADQQFAAEKALTSSMVGAPAGMSQKQIRSEAAVQTEILKKLSAFLELKHDVKAGPLSEQITRGSVLLGGAGQAAANKGEAAAKVAIKMLDEAFKGTKLHEILGKIDGTLNNFQNGLDASNSMVAKLQAQMARMAGT